MSEKVELNVVVAKIERSLNNGSENQSVHVIKTERVSLQNKYDGVQPSITANKTKQTEDKNK